MPYAHSTNVVHTDEHWQETSNEDNGDCYPVTECDSWHLAFPVKSLYIHERKGAEVKVAFCEEPNRSSPEQVVVSFVGHRFDFGKLFTQQVQKKHDWSQHDVGI